MLRFQKASLSLKLLFLYVIKIQVVHINYGPTN